MSEENNAMKNSILLSACAALLLGACAIPGIGPYGSDKVNLYLNSPFTNPSDKQRHPGTGGVYGYGKEWLYRTEPEGSGTRYYIRLYYERCKYSLYVDDKDIIKSWRDEGGTSHMSRCLLR
jgi:hypothetical protein